MIQMHEIRYFLALARELNFTRAAATCAVSQPALTRAIRNLENKVGGLLFERRSGAIGLTELGRTMLPHMENSYSEMEMARSQAAQVLETRKGQLRIGVMCTAGPAVITGLIRQLLAKLDNTEISVRDARAGTVVEMLLANEVDVAIAAWPVYPEEIEAMPLYSERYAVMFPERHLFNQLEEVPLMSLSGEDYIERLACEFDDHFEAQVGEWPVDTTTRFASEREDWIQAMVLAGVGVAIIPAKMPVRVGLAVRLLTDPDVRRSVDLLTVRGRLRAPATDIFVRLARTFDWGAVCV
ncbi:MAG: LysR family transcriptional regulator [Hyphomicrobiaceae bacterium]